MVRASKYKWFILILAALTGAFVIGAPATSLAVLFKEISSELHLNLVQMGLVWSIGSLLAILSSPLSGALDDHFGPKRVMISGIILVSLTAGMRGLATGFASLLLIIVVVGGLVPLVTTSSYKISGIWFPHGQLGLANGVLAMGMAFGALLGALLSAQVLSPALGGWRHVLFFYAALAVLFCIPWLFTRSAPTAAKPGTAELVTVPMRQALTRIVKLKNVWLIGITFLGIAGCVQGIAGYLPFYLRGLGWSGASADGALSFLNAMSMVFILPIMFWTDRLRTRKWLLVAMVITIAMGTVLLSITNGLAAWGAIALVGMVRDGSTAVLITMVIETNGVGPVYAGTATGFVMFFFFAGNLFAPPIGNQLAEISPGAPFLFWGGLAALGIVSLLFAKSSRAENAPLGFRGIPEVIEPS
jgi:NNP family nitrate/nitrite transporter-like MFS transporter